MIQIVISINNNIQEDMWNAIDKFPNWTQIRDKLVELVEMKHDSKAITKMIQEFGFYSSIDANNKIPVKESSENYHIEEGKFLVLQQLYEKQLPKIFSKISKYLLQRPNQKIPLFYQDQEKQCKLKKQEILYLFCSMILCLIPRQKFHDNQQRDNFTCLMDFSFIFTEQQYKTKTVIEYIKQELQKFQNKTNTQEEFIIKRQVQKRTIQEIIEQNHHLPMSKLHLQSDQKSIEDFYGDLKADFANKYIGGGALMSGCVQEEIMFANHPQLYTTQLLCQVMKPNESIVFLGFKKYFKNKGYGYQCAYDGKQDHKYENDGQNKHVAKEYISAIDAIPFGTANQYIQFKGNLINREIVKAFCGFNFQKPDLTRMVTGNWGCGAFSADLKLKFLVQWLACSLAKKQMIYCPFGSRKVLYNEKIITAIQNMKIGQTYNLIHKASQKLTNENKSLNIYAFIEQQLSKKIPINDIL